MPEISIDPPHIRLAKTQLQEAGILQQNGLAALNLASQLYQSSPQVNLTDSLRKERNQTQDELERVSSDLVMERRKIARLQTELAEALARPNEHKKAAYKLRKRLREILALLTDAQAKPTSKIRRAVMLVTTALAGAPPEDDIPEPLVTPGKI